MLNLTITGILAIIVVILALIVVLLGMTGRVKKLNTKLKVVQEDNITPYLRTVSHYRKSDFTDESKINALNKVSKQFFRDFLNFNSEKTFDEISSMSNDLDIKDFCSSMGIIRYSKSVKKSDVDSLYRSFENILIKRRPASAIVLNNNSGVKTMTMEELNNRKFRKDIADIKVELDKMKNQAPIKIEHQESKEHSYVKQDEHQATNNEISNSNSLVKYSVDEKLSQIEEEIDNESTHQESPQDNNHEESNLEEKEKSQINKPKTVPNEINPNKVVGNLIKGYKIQSTIPNKEKRFKPSNLSFRKVRPGSDNESLSREITNLNQRIQKLLDAETDRRLDEIRGY